MGCWSGEEDCPLSDQVQDWRGSRKHSAMCLGDTEQLPVSGVLVPWAKAVLSSLCALRTGWVWGGVVLQCRSGGKLTLMDE